ncbi:MAG: hypothetical protein ABI606_19235, partial [Rhodoferax sp.]
MLLALKSAWFWMSLVLRRLRPSVVLPLKLFLLASMAAWVLVMVPPLSSVLPLTLTWKPPSPARMPDCCVTD